MIRPINPLFLIGSIGIGKLHEIEKICGACQSKLTNGICSTMDCMHQAMKVPSEDVVEIVSFNVKEQLRSLINNNLDLVKKYQQQARDQATCDPNDIVRAEVYQSILATHRDFFVSVVTHSDGIPLYKSKNCSAWPVLGAVLELPPFARTRADNVLLLSVWIGKRKPDFGKLFEKLADQLTVLKQTGIQINSHDKAKVLFPMLMGDMPALSAMVRFVEPNAFYACMFCDTKGTYSHEGHCVTYPIDEDAELRTSESFRKRAELAASMTNRVDRERTIGLKGLSTFSLILDVPLPHSVVIDAMHTVFLCHTKKLLLHLCSRISKVNVSKVSDKLSSMNYIHDILRRPRSLSHVHKWKASEVRVFILYIGLPVPVEFMPEDEAGHLALYIVILRLLHDYWDKDKKSSEGVSALTKLYVGELSRKVDSHLYPPKLLTITTHTHLHLPLQCKKFGRLDWLTNFVFESFLGFLKAFVKGSSGAGDQIAFAFEANFFLSKLREKPSRSFGHFSIDGNHFGSNLLKIRSDDPLAKFLLKHGCNPVDVLLFSRLHRFNVTFHSFLYARKGSTCSYLVSYERQGALLYGYILCFLLKDGECFVVLQQLSRVDHSISHYFKSYKYTAAIKDFIDDVYVIFKRVQPSLFDFDRTEIYPVSSIQSRCFSVPIGSDLMAITCYSCAFEHN